MNGAVLFRLRLASTSTAARDAETADRLEQTARKLTLPVQLVRGNKSELVTEETAKAFLGFIPGARFDDIAGAGHMVVGDRNDAFSQAISEFLIETSA